MFEFLHEKYLFLLLPWVLLLVAYIYIEYMRKKKMLRIGDIYLLKRQMAEVSDKRRRAHFLLLWLALGLMILMLARPQYGQREVTEKRAGIEIALMVDVSNSMLATDIQPNRLERVKTFVSNLIEDNKDNNISLGVFAGEAYPEIPMTHDHTSISVCLQALTPQMVSSQGTNLAAAIDVAANSFNEKQRKGKAIVLFTDGEDHEGNIDELLKTLKDRHIKLFVLGVGTTEGSMIASKEGIIRDSDGKAVVTRLNEKMCEQLADESEGKYIKIDHTDVSLRQLEGALSNIEKTETEETYNSKNEQFQAFAVLIIFILCVEFFLMERKNRLGMKKRVNDC